LPTCQFAPIISKRISYTRNSDYAIYDPGGYYVNEPLPLNQKQVASTYAWFASLLVWLFTSIYFGDALEKRIGDADTAAGLWLTTLAGLLAMPFLLRRLAKKRKIRRWKRMNAGLEQFSIDP